ncbi:MAG: hypothetical protein KC416_14265, partial [Myxococcales bacterium]|nr:hypothetical protein [Myxococcales bacterium]
QFRDEEHGKAIDTSGSARISGEAEDTEYVDGLDLVSQIAESEQGKACFAGWYSTFALGTRMSITRRAQLNVDFSESGASIQQLLVGLTQDDIFYYRKILEENP